MDFGEEVSHLENRESGYDTTRKSNGFPEGLVEVFSTPGKGPGDDG